MCELGTTVVCMRALSVCHDECVCLTCKDAFHEATPDCCSLSRRGSLGQGGTVGCPIIPDGGPAWHVGIQMCCPASVVAQLVRNGAAAAALQLTCGRLLPGCTSFMGNNFAPDVQLTRTQRSTCRAHALRESPYLPNLHI